MISSTANKKIKDIVALRKKAALRRETGSFLVEGLKIFLEIPRNRIREIYFSESFCKAHKDLVSEHTKQYRAEIVSDTVFAYMSDTRTPQGVLAVVSMENTDIGKILVSDRNTALLLLEDIQDPGNLGTMLRTAEAAGITGIIMSRDTVDVYNPKVIRSTMGAIFRMPFLYVEDLMSTVQDLQRKKIKVYASALKAATEYDRINMSEHMAIIIGNEAAGISAGLLQKADQCIQIPMLGKVESLNAAAAASVLMFEMARQRRMDAGSQ